MGHIIEDQLVTLDIIDRSAVTEFYPGVRDRADVKVLRCNRSGVIYLSSSDHIAADYYNEKKGASYWSTDTRESGLKETATDDKRRFDQFKEFIAGKNYLDVGSGLGGVLDLFQTVAKKVTAIEPQAEMRHLLKGLGYDVYESLANTPVKNVEVITLFHVFEHLTNPLLSLQQMHSMLAPNGTIIIEVPHARDILLETFQLDAFKKFTFWSEHLILHTRKSLETFLAAAGFRNIHISGMQRYPLANHLYWLGKGKPGGHNQWPQLRDKAAEDAYAGLLESIDQTDTLIASAEK
jgi:2-polyprenyl-3-methyl-5-hydroxy-6-metoxy-1,4-benzoquinol methylase